MLERVKQILQSDQPAKWLFTGDSITHGALHTYGSRDYVQIFEERLRYELGRGRDFVLKTAISGWRSDTILEDISWNILQFEPLVVSIMVGMNDAASGLEYPDTFEKNYNEILDKIQNSNRCAIILHTPQPIVEGGEPSREPALPHIAQRIRNIADRRNLILVDHHQHWNEALQQNPIRALQWLNDAIHPGKFGHMEMAKLLLKTLEIWDENSICCSML